MTRQIALVGLAVAFLCSSSAGAQDDCPNTQFPSPPPLTVCAPDQTSAELDACRTVAGCSGTCADATNFCDATACAPAATCEPDPGGSCTGLDQPWLCDFPPAMINGFCECVTCAMAVELWSTEVSPGERLKFDVRIRHWREKTIEAAYTVWVEDYGGVVLTGHESEEFIVAYGDRYRNKDSIRIPETMEPGLYRLVFSLPRMYQGTLRLARPFTVLGE